MRALEQEEYFKIISAMMSFFLLTSKEKVSHNWAHSLHDTRIDFKDPNNTVSGFKIENDSIKKHVKI